MYCGYIFYDYYRDMSVLKLYCSGKTVLCIFNMTVLSRYKCANAVSVFHMTVLSLCAI